MGSRSRTGVERAISVGVVDDDAIVRAWVRLALEGSEFRIAGEAATADEGLSLVERRRPDLLLVDFNLPDRPGTEFVRSLRERRDGTPALVITAAPRVGLNESVQEAGAQGVVLKQSDTSELLRALRRIASGGTVVEPAHPRRPESHSALTPRERDALRLAATGATNPQIAARLGISRESVKTLLRRSYTKLGVTNRVAAIDTARERGLL